MYDFNRPNQLPTSFIPADGYENMSYAEFVKNRELKNLETMGNADLHRKPTQMPTFKSFIARMQAQNFPTKTIINSAKPPLTACITPVHPSEIEDPNRQYVTATFSTKDYVIDKTLSTHPVRQYVSKKSPYIPSGHKEIFIKGTSRPVPPVIFQSQITAAAKVYAIMRHQNLDTESFETIFRWMWGLPKDFSLSPYAPLIDSDVTKPWVHLKARGNYEVQYMSAQQGMIHVTTGSETGVYAGTKYEVDWEFIRTVARNIMTRVLFIESHRDHLAEMSGFKLKFYVRYDNHFPQYTPKWKYLLPNTESMLKLPNDQLLLLAGATADPNKLYVFPKLLMDYLTMHAPISIPIMATLPKKLPQSLELDVDEADLTDTLKVPFTYKFIQPLAIEDSKIIRQPLRIRDLVKQYFIQYGMTSESNINKLFAISAFAKFKTFARAYDELIEIADMQELAKLNNLYSTISENRYSAARDIWEFYVGKESHFNKIQSLDPRFLINHAKYLQHDSLIKCVNEALRCIQNKILIPNAYTLVRFIRPLSSYDDNLLTMKKGIRDLIQKFYVIGYLKKLKVAKTLLFEENDKIRIRELKNNIIKYQFLSKIFPLVNGTDDPKRICEFIYEMALRYTKKRRRYHERMKEFTITTKDPTVLAQQLDDMLKSSFSQLLKLLYEAVYQADHDIDVLFLDEADYLIRYNRNQSFSKRMRKLTSLIMPTFIKQAPDKERYVVKGEDQEIYKELICDENKDHLNYTQFAERYKVPKLMRNRPQFLSRQTYVKMHTKKAKKKYKKVEKEHDESIVPKIEATMTADNEPHLKIIEEPIIDIPKVKEIDPPPISNADSGMDFLDTFDDTEEIDFSKIWVSDYISTQSLPWTVEGLKRICEHYKIDLDVNEPTTIELMEQIRSDYDKEITAISVALLRSNRASSNAQDTDLIQ